MITNERFLELVKLSRDTTPGAVIDVRGIEEGDALSRIVLAKRKQLMDHRPGGIANVTGEKGEERYDRHVMEYHSHLFDLERAKWHKRSFLSRLFGRREDGI